MKTILYTRVSTDEQANKGHGRDYQKEVLRRYCQVNNYEVIAEFEEDHSAKNFNRPEWKKLELFVKANKKSIDKVIFTKWDRFSRDIYNALDKIKSFQKWGIELNAAEQTLDLSNPDNKLMLSVYLTVPEVENDKISQRTRSGMYKAAKDGAWIGRVPYGYERHHFGKFASLKPNEESKLVQDAFYEVSLGLLPCEEIRRKFEQRGYSGVKQSFLNLLRNKVYLGMTKVPKYDNDEAFWIDGLHNAIIDVPTFNKVQAILEGKNRAAKPPSIINEAMPLRGFLECEYCKGNLTGSISKGNGGQYGYYHCRRNCKNRIPTTLVHEMFDESILSDFIVNDNVLELYKEVLLDIQKTKLGSKSKTENNSKKMIDELSKKIESAEDKYINGELSQDVFKRIISRYEKERMSLKADYTEIKESKGLSVKAIEKAVDGLKNIPKLYKNGSYDTKVQLLGLIIPKKLIISKNGCRTKEKNVVVELLTRVNKVSQRAGTKKAIISDGLSNMAPPAGLEPATP